MTKITNDTVKTISIPQDLYRHLLANQSNYIELLSTVADGFSTGTSINELKATIESQSKAIRSVKRELTELRVIISRMSQYHEGS